MRAAIRFNADNTIVDNSVAKTDEATLNSQTIFPNSEGKWPQQITPGISFKNPKPKPTCSDK